MENGRLVLTRENEQFTEVSIPLATLKKLVADGRDAKMRFRTYDIGFNREGVGRVKLAFEDKDRLFDIERPERLGRNDKV